MIRNEFIGARYVPLFADPVEWDDSRTYEPLTIVTHEGNSYTSKQYVPVGITITNADFWVETGNYDAQVENYRRIAMQSAIAFDTVANMQSYTEFESGMIAHTNGFHTAGDGGAAWYVITNNGTPNGMDVLECHDGLIAHLVINKHLSIKAFGAIADGEFDDTDYMQRAINTVGVANIDNCTVKITGLSIPSSFIQINGCNGSLILESPTDNFALKADTPNIEFNNLKIICDKAPKTNIHSDYGILNDGGAGMMLGSVRTMRGLSVKFNNCTFIRTNIDGIDNSNMEFGHFILACNVNTLVIENCTGAINGGTVIRGTSNLNSGNDDNHCTNISNIKIIGNSINLDSTILDSTFVDLDNCNASRYSKYANDNIVISNNKITGNGVKCFGIGYIRNFVFSNNVCVSKYVCFDCDNPNNGSITGNTFTNTQIANGECIRIATNIDYSDDHVCKNVICSNNTFINAYEGIALNMAENVNINGNIFESVVRGIFAYSPILVNIFNNNIKFTDVAFYLGITGIINIENNVIECTANEAKLFMVSFTSANEINIIGNIFTNCTGYESSAAAAAINILKDNIPFNYLNPYDSTTRMKGNVIAGTKFYPYPNVEIECMNSNSPYSNLSATVKGTRYNVTSALNEHEAIVFATGSFNNFSGSTTVPHVMKVVNTTNEAISCILPGIGSVSIAANSSKDVYISSTEIYAI